MMKMFDFNCEKCNKDYKDILLGNNETGYTCPSCGSECKKLPSAPMGYLMDQISIWERNKKVTEFSKPKYRTKK